MAHIVSLDSFEKSPRNEPIGALGSCAGRPLNLNFVGQTIEKVSRRNPFRGSMLE